MPKLAREDLHLFGASALLLFVEILMIRWLSAELRVFAYFHNLVLLFAFLGMGLGMLIPGRRQPMWLPFGAIAVLVGLVSLSDHLGAFSLKLVTDYLSAGTGFEVWAPDLEAGARFGRAGALLAGTGQLVLVLGLLVAAFVPFGQRVGRLMNEAGGSLRAYGFNLAGSLAGLWLFSALSWASLPPMVWFAVAGAGTLLLAWPSRLQMTAIVALLCVILPLSARTDPTNDFTVWSPYQKLEAKRSTVKIVEREGPQDIPYGHYIYVNSTHYMQTVNYRPDFMRQHPYFYPPQDVPYDHYNVPYRVAKRIDDVLVVGAGAGNDVAAALRHGARRVTAVEIDPQILRLGVELHPEAPYADKRVKLVNDDARAFFKRSSQKFDLIVFGLLDSHTLSSSFSNVRLDNYVYTLESFKEAKRLLRPNGVLVLLFESADSFVGARFYRMLTSVFGFEPLDFEVRSQFRGWGGHLFATGDKATLNEVMNADPRLGQMWHAHEGVRRGWAETRTVATTDDWPYMWLMKPGLPRQYLVVFAVLLLLSIGGVRAVLGKSPPLDSRFFFLGAGFMLLEVQNVSKLSLLFGSTWSVNSLVISAILVMAMLANWLASRLKEIRPEPWYGLLGLALLLNFAVPPDALAALPTGIREVAAGVLLGLPIFFSGVVFSGAFKTTTDRASALASNLLGAMAGGMLEMLSMVLGIRALLLLALTLYVLAWVAERRGGPVLAENRT